MWRDMALATLASAGGQGIMLLATPLLARSYGPVPFGHWSIVVAVAGVIATIAALRFDQALGGAPDGEVKKLALLALVLPLAVVPVLALVLDGAILFGYAKAFDRAIVPMVAVVAVPQGLVTVLVAIAIRVGKFRALAVMRFAQPLIFVAAALLVVRHLETAMAIGWCVAALAGLLYLLPLGDRSDIGDAAVDTCGVVRRYWQFPVIATPLSFLDVLALALPVLFIAGSYGPGVAGAYGQLQRLLGGPLSILAAAAGQVYVRHAGVALRVGGDDRRIMRQILLAMLALAFATLSAVILVGEPLLALVLGPKWQIGRDFLIAATISFLPKAIGAPISGFFPLTRRVTTFAGWQFCYFLSTLSILALATRHLPPGGALLVLACGDSLLYSALVLLAWTAARRRAAGAG